MTTIDARGLAAMRESYAATIVALAHANAEQAAQLAQLQGERDDQENADAQP